MTREGGGGKGGERGVTINNEPTRKESLRTRGECFHIKGKREKKTQGKVIPDVIGGGGGGKGPDNSPNARATGCESICQLFWKERGGETREFRRLIGCKEGRKGGGDLSTSSTCFAEVRILGGRRKKTRIIKSIDQKKRRRRQKEKKPSPVLPLYEKKKKKERVTRLFISLAGGSSNSFQMGKKGTTKIYITHGLTRRGKEDPFSLSTNTLRDVVQSSAFFFAEEKRKGERLGFFGSRKRGEEKGYC